MVQSALVYLGQGPGVPSNELTDFNSGSVPKPTTHEGTLNRNKRDQWLPRPGGMPAGPIPSRATAVEKAFSNVVHSDFESGAIAPRGATGITSGFG